MDGENNNMIEEKFSDNNLSGIQFNNSIEMEKINYELPKVNNLEDVNVTEVVKVNMIGEMSSDNKLFGMQLNNPNEEIQYEFPQDNHLGDVDIINRGKDNMIEAIQYKLSNANNLEDVNAVARVKENMTQDMYSDNDLPGMQHNNSNEMEEIEYELSNANNLDDVNVIDGTKDNALGEMSSHNNLPGIQLNNSNEMEETQYELSNANNLEDVNVIDGKKDNALGEMSSDNNLPGIQLNNSNEMEGIQYELSNANNLEDVDVTDGTKANESGEISSDNNLSGIQLNNSNEMEETQYELSDANNLEDVDVTDGTKANELGEVSSDNNLSGIQLNNSNEMEETQYELSDANNLKDVDVTDGTKANELGEVSSDNNLSGIQLNNSNEMEETQYELSNANNLEDVNVTDATKANESGEISSDNNLSGIQLNNSNEMEETQYELSDANNLEDVNVTDGTKANDLGEISSDNNLSGIQLNNSNEMEETQYELSDANNLEDVNVTDGTKANDLGEISSDNNLSGILLDNSNQIEEIKHEFPNANDSEDVDAIDGTKDNLFEEMTSNNKLPGQHNNFIEMEEIQYELPKANNLEDVVNVIDEVKDKTIEKKSEIQINNSIEMEELLDEFPQSHNSGDMDVQSSINNHIQVINIDSSTNNPRSLSTESNPNDIFSYPNINECTSKDKDHTQIPGPTYDPSEMMPDAESGFLMRKLQESLQKFDSSVPPSEPNGFIKHKSNSNEFSQKSDQHGPKVISEIHKNNQEELGRGIEFVRRNIVNLHFWTNGIEYTIDTCQLGIVPVEKYAQIDKRGVVKVSKDDIFCANEDIQKFIQDGLASYIAKLTKERNVVGNSEVRSVAPTESSNFSKKNRIRSVSRIPKVSSTYSNIPNLPIRILPDRLIRKITYSQAPTPNEKQTGARLKIPNMKTIPIKVNGGTDVTAYVFVSPKAFYYHSERMSLEQLLKERQCTIEDFATYILDSEITKKYFASDSSETSGCSSSEVSPPLFNPPEVSEWPLSQPIAVDEKQGSSIGGPLESKESVTSFGTCGIKKQCREESAAVLNDPNATTEMKMEALFFGIDDNHCQGKTGDHVCKCWCKKIIAEPEVPPKQESDELNLELKTLKTEVTCDLCERTYKLGTNHKCKKNGKNEQNFECHLCNRSFTRQAYLSNHMRSHKEYLKATTKCQVCQRRFYKTELTEHHHMDHPEILLEYSCVECGMIFKKAKELKKHQKEHSSVLCPHCNAFFEKGYFDRRHQYECYHNEELLLKPTAKRSVVPNSDMINHYTKVEELSDEIEAAVSDSQESMKEYNEVQLLSRKRTLDKSGTTTENELEKIPNKIRIVQSKTDDEVNTNNTPFYSEIFDGSKNFKEGEGNNLIYFEQILD